MKYIVSIALLFAGMVTVSAQDKYITKNGFVKFFSSAPLEDIEADNNNVQSIVDLAASEVVINIPIQSFEFDKSLMKEHFNENYLESEKFPKASFKGKYDAGKQLTAKDIGSHTVAVTGDLTIHGVTRPLLAKATLIIKAGGVQAKTKFDVRVADFDIEIPRIVFKNIAEVVEVTVDLQYTKLDKQ
ncbi:MAG: YceI family protein [Bacteroidota bacterium]